MTVKRGAAAPDVWKSGHSGRSSEIIARRFNKKTTHFTLSAVRSFLTIKPGVSPWPRSAVPGPVARVSSEVMVFNEKRCLKTNPTHSDLVPGKTAVVARAYE